MLLLAVAVGAIVVGVVAVARPDAASRLPRATVLLAGAVGAVAVGISDVSPTGWTGLDIALRVAVGAAVPLAAARAGTLATSWLALVAVAVALITDAPGGAVAAVAAGAFWAAAASGSARGPAAAVAAAAALGPLAHASWPLVTGASAAAMLAGVAPVVLLGAVRTPRPARRRLGLALALLVAMVGLGSLAGALAALQARTDIDVAVDAATEGIDLLGDDDDAARARLLDAAAAFEDAESVLRSWWGRTALVVPGIAQQSRAVSTMATAGADLARTAADASSDADIDSVRPRDGRIDLDALEALAEPLQRSLTSLERADSRLTAIRSPLLLAPVADRLTTLHGEVERALGSAQLAAQAVEVAPAMLGADGPRRYFIAFQNPAEITGNGGFLGNWAELTARDGELVLSRNGRNSDLTEGGRDPDRRRIVGEPEFVANWGRSAARYWGNINLTPDHPTVGRIIAQLYPQSGGRPVDGVIAVTPQGLAAFLGITGPIQVAGYPEPLGADNLSRVMLHEQYLAYPQDEAQDREAFLAETVEVLFDSLLSGDLPGPRALAAQLGPAVEARHLQLWAERAEEQDLLARLGATGSVARDRVDSFGVVTQNVNGNKIDWFQHRTVSYDAHWDPATREVTAELRVRVENRAPDTGLPPSIIGWGGYVSLGQRPVADGENFMHLSLYASLPIERITVDGEEVGFVAGEELGHERTWITLSVPSQSAREVVAELRGVVAPASRYILRPIRQPMINPDRFELALSVPPGWEIDTVRGGERSEDGATALTREDATTAMRMVVDVAPERGRRGLLERLRGIR